MYRDRRPGVARTMKMRKAAAVAFHEADRSQALRPAALSGPRRMQDFEVGQAVYIFRRGGATAKKQRQACWVGPGWIVMASLPNAVWIAYNTSLVKAAPERVRHCTIEEKMSASGWLRGISQTRQSLESMPKEDFVDLTGGSIMMANPKEI